jgi:hypothetical protein
MACIFRCPNPKKTTIVPFVSSRSKISDLATSLKSEHIPSLDPILLPSFYGYVQEAGRIEPGYPVRQHNEWRNGLL